MSVRAPVLPAVLRLRVVDLTLAIRASSPEFRWSPLLRGLLAVALLLAAPLLGALVTVLTVSGASLAEAAELPPGAGAVVLRGLAAWSLLASTLSVSTLGARQLLAPADARILQHAGLTRWRVLLAREGVGAVGGALAITTAALMSFLALGRRPGSTELHGELATVLWCVIAGLLWRLHAAAALGRWPDRRWSRIPIALLVSAALGLVAAVLVDRAFGSGWPSPVEVGGALVDVIGRPQSTVQLAGVGVLLCSASALLSTRARVALARPWVHIPVGSARGASSARHPLRVLATLAVLGSRDAARSDAYDGITWWRRSCVLGAAALGLTLAGPSGIGLPASWWEPLLGLTAVTAALGWHGVTSLSATRELRRHLYCGQPSVWSVNLALVIGGVLAVGAVTWPLVPSIWWLSGAPLGPVLATWAVATLTAVVAMHGVDALLPPVPQQSATRLSLPLANAAMATGIVTVVGGLAAALGGSARVGVAAVLTLAMTVVVVIIRPRQEAGS